MEDPNLASIPVTFAIDSATAASLQASATRNGGMCAGQQLFIDENRAFSGGWCTCPANPPLC